MPLINALRRMHPSVSLEIARSRAAAVVRRAICVAVLSEETQQLLPLIPCGTTPGGVLNSTHFSRQDRAVPFILPKWSETFGG